LKSQSAHLKNTSCWTIACICQRFPELPVEFLDHFIPPLGEMLTTETPDISNYCCFAIHNIAEAFQEQSSEATSNLTKYYQNLITALVDVASRPDGNEIGLRASAFEAITALIHNGAQDTIAVDLDAIGFFMDRLSATFQMKIERNEDKEAQIELQGYLCIILSQITQKVGPKILPYHGKMLQLLLNVFQYHSNSSKATIHEDVLLVLGSVATAIGPDFSTYFPHFLNFILQAFKCTQDASLIRNCIGLVTDVCDALKKQFSVYCKDILLALSYNLRDEFLDRAVKPLIITCFGDIANAIGDAFLEYLPEVCNVLVVASMTPRGDKDDEDYEEFLGNLRCSIFDAYAGIIQGLRQDGKDILFLETQANTAPLFQFIDNLASEIQQDEDVESKREEILKGMVGVIGDFAEIGGPETAKFLNRPNINYLLQLTKKHQDDRVRQIGEWAFLKAQALYSNR